MFSLTLAALALSSVPSVVLPVLTVLTASSAVSSVFLPIGFDCVSGLLELLFGRSFIIPHQLYHELLIKAGALLRL